MNRTMAWLTTRQSYRILAMLPALALLLGGGIYIFLRPTEPLFIEWARSAGLDAIINLARPDFFVSNYLFPDWIVYSMPGALWAFAYALVITRIWAGNQHWIRYFWFSTIPLLVFGFEILQYPGIIPGTFSVPDLLAGLLGSLAGASIGITSKNRLDHENKIC